MGGITDPIRIGNRCGYWAVTTDGRQLVDAFQRHFYIPDPGALLVTLGSVVANLLDGDPVWKHHQFLTEHTGDPHLDRQIIEVTALMRVSEDKGEFDKMFGRASPKRGDQLKLDLKAKLEPSDKDQ